MEAFFAVAPGRRLLVLLSVDYFRALTARPHHLIDFLLDKGARLTVVYPRYRSDPQAHLGQKLASIVRFVIEHGFVEVRNLRGMRTVGIFPLPLPDALVPLQVCWLLFWTLLYVRGERDRVAVTEGPLGGSVGTVLRRLGMVTRHVYEDLDYFPGFYQGLAGAAIGSLERSIVRNADEVVTTCDELKAFRETQTRKPVTVVPNGVIYGSFAAAWNVPKSPEPTAIFVGFLADWAGVELSIRAVALTIVAMPSLQYVIVGPGDITTLAELARTLHLDGHIAFLDCQPKSELPALLGAAHVALAPFRPTEHMKYAFPQTVIEYMAAGLPVIGTDVGVTGRLLRESGGGLAVPHEASAFSRAIQSVLTDARLYEGLRFNAIRFAKAYDYARVLEKEWSILRLGFR